VQNPVRLCGKIFTIKLNTILKIARDSYKVGLVLLLLTILFSCDRKMDVIKNLDILSLPTTTVRNFESVYTDSTKLQLILSSPLMESYTRVKPPYTEFTKGMTALFYDGNDKPIASITSKYAKFLDDKKIWELRDSVVAVNEKNERLDTELLYWDRDKDQFYTDRFVRITGEDQIVMGIGMKSDSRFTNWWIRNVSATIPVTDE
jgi:LPS export ABC transporter protein LptC